MADQPVLELRGITKRFPGIVANDKVDLDLLPGEVHALLGENGAGKSTLMNVLYGLYHPDEGEIRVKGQALSLGSPHEAIEHGIGMVHQHFMLIPVMTVAENIVLAVEPKRNGVLLDFAVQSHQVMSQQEIYALRADARARINTVFMTTVFTGGAIASAVTGLLHARYGWTGACLLGAAFPLVGLLVWATGIEWRRDRRQVGSVAAGSSVRG